MRARLIRLNIPILLLISFAAADQVETPTLIAQIGRERCSRSSGISAVNMC